MLTLFQALYAWLKRMEKLRCCRSSPLTCLLFSKYCNTWMKHNKLYGRHTIDGDRQVQYQCSADSNSWSAMSKLVVFGVLPAFTSMPYSCTKVASCSLVTPC